MLRSKYFRGISRRGGTLFLGALLGLGIGAAQAASPVESTFGSGFNLWSDDNAEYLINCTPGVSPAPCASTPGDTTLDLGDRLRGTLNINAVSHGGPPIGIGSGSNGAVNELTAVFDTRVIAKIPVAGQFIFVFGSSGAITGFPTAVAAIYESATYNWTRECGPTATSGSCLAVDDGEPGLTGADIGLITEGPAATILGPGVGEELLLGLATDGTLRLVLGFAGDPDEVWTTGLVSTDNILIARATAAPGSAGAANVQLSILLNSFPNTTFTQVPTTLTGGPGNDLIDFNITTSILGTAGFNTPFDIFSDTNLVFAPHVVPEPSTLSLLGLGLLGVAFAAYRRRQS